MVDFSRMYAAEMGAFGERFTLLDGVSFTGILLKHSDETIEIGFRQTLESWRLLVMPIDAAQIDLAEGTMALDGVERLVEIDSAAGERYQIQSRQVNSDGFVEYSVSLLR